MGLRRTYKGCFVFGCFHSASALALALFNYFIPAAILVVTGACLVWSSVIVQRIYIESLTRRQ